jgi:hypothetical protein
MCENLTHAFRLLGNVEVPYRVHIVTDKCTVSLHNRLEIYFNIILLPALACPGGLFPSGFPTKHLCAFVTSPCVLPALPTTYRQSTFGTSHHTLICKLLSYCHRLCLSVQPTQHIALAVHLQLSGCSGGATKCPWEVLCRYGAKRPVTVVKIT